RDDLDTYLTTLRSVVLSVLGGLSLIVGVVSMVIGIRRQTRDGMVSLPYLASGLSVLGLSFVCGLIGVLYAIARADREDRMMARNSVRQAAAPMLGREHALAEGADRNQGLMKGDDKGEPQMPADLIVVPMPERPAVREEGEAKEALPHDDVDKADNLGILIGE